MPNFQNAGHGPRDDVAGQKDIHIKARTMLMIRALSVVHVGLPFPVRLRPHTRCYLTGAEGTPLGIIFVRWEPQHTELLVRETNKDEVVREGLARFAHDRSGKEVGLFMAERWMWKQLLAKYKGLSFGNL